MAYPVRLIPHRMFLSSLTLFSTPFLRLFNLLRSPPDICCLFFIVSKLLSRRKSRSRKDKSPFLVNYRLEEAILALISFAGLPSFVARLPKYFYRWTLSNCFWPTKVCLDILTLDFFTLISMHLFCSYVSSVGKVQLAFLLYSSRPWQSIVILISAKLKRRFLLLWKTK